MEEEIPDKIDTLSGMPMTRKVVKPVIYTWGLNSSGQLGLGDEKNRNRPEMVQKVWNATEIRMGGEFTIAFVKSIKRTFSFRIPHVTVNSEMVISTIATHLVRYVP